jgi:hypothetical protein
MMSKDLKTQILEAEDRLRLAMLSSDIDVLDELLSDNLVFTNHLGQCLTKEDDLSAHRSSALVISRLAPTELKMSFVCDTVAIVSVRVFLDGVYAGKPAGGDFRFTRVWALTSNNTWQVVAAHAGIIA